MRQVKTPLYKQHPGRQAGAALIISLVILLAMTLIGVSSMDSAVLELKMAGTMQQQIVAMNRAEATLMVAETAIDNITTDGTTYNFETTGNGFYPPVNTLDLEQVDWAGISTEVGPVDSANSIDDDDKYVIEYLGIKPIPGETVKMDPNGAIVGGAVHTFRNTTRSASGRDVVRMVQSVYVTLGAP